MSTHGRLRQPCTCTLTLKTFIHITFITHDVIIKPVLTVLLKFKYLKNKYLCSYTTCLRVLCFCCLTVTDTPTSLQTIWWNRCMLNVSPISHFWIGLRNPLVFRPTLLAKYSSSIYHHAVVFHKAIPSSSVINNLIIPLLSISPSRLKKSHCLFFLKPPHIL